LILSGLKAMHYDYLETPIGRLLLAGNDNGLARIEFDDARQGGCIQPHWQRGAASLREPLDQLAAYFRGDLLDFQLPLAPQGTLFQLEVWACLARIPYAQTTSYGAIARELGRPAASRAVGAANGANPLPIVVPCHRVIGTNGTLTGFGGGLPVKRWLLEHERRHAPLPAFALS
jgi:methylated-DNA-[protein]-cysteine S-methyltransferase